MTNGSLSRDCYLLLNGNVLSLVGDIFYLIVINIWVSRVCDTPDVLSYIIAVGSFSLFLFNPLGGYFADRYSKKMLLIYTDLFSFLAVILVYFNYREDVIPFYILCFTNVILSICFSIYSPTVRATTPLIVRGNGVVKFNSLLSISNEIMKTLTPLLAMFLLSSDKIGESYFILINAFSFFVSAIINSMLNFEVSDDDKKKNEINYIIVWNSIGKYKFSLFPLALSNFFLGGVNVLLPYIGKESGGNSYTHFILFQAFGAAIGGYIFSKKNKVISHSESLIFLLISSLAMMCMSAHFNKILNLLAIFILGACITIYHINFFSIMQKLTPNEMMGRLASIIYMAIASLAPIGNLLIPYIDEITSGFGLFTSGFLMFFIMACSYKKMSNIESLEIIKTS
ncbi:MFS transporter [Pseudoalteromonas piscicida]|uniref:MFS transporter n=1 Tax=Pseudoalteromonas piscicida TaxID=43662 RepID=UPI0030CA0C5C